MSGSAPGPQVRRCPTCQATIDAGADARWRPFCSQRCKQVDLGAWLSESYRIPAEEQDDGEDGLADDRGPAT